MNIKPIIIVAGSPRSIFLEIFFKAIKKKINSPIILICDKKNFFKQYKRFNIKKKINILDIDKIKKFKFFKKINLIDVKINYSKNSKNNIKQINEYIKKCFKLSFQLINQGITNKFINGPINKKEFLNKKFLGITEYISSYYKTKKGYGMLIYNKKLSVCPLTTHVPIKLITKKITFKLLVEKIDLIDNFFKSKLGIKPKIAVTGLNPHCESVSYFNEDEKIVSPAIKFSKKKGISVSGPYAADTIFLKNNRKKFDVILGMYHDQVLTPLKTLYEYDAINITMGLPFLRVSPDHGPNESMLYKNLSNPTSLAKALEFLDNN